MDYTEASKRVDEVVRQAKLAAKDEESVITNTDETHFVLGWLRATLIHEYQRS